MNGLNKGETNHYRPRDCIHIPPFLISNVVDAIISSQRDVKSY